MNEEKNVEVVDPVGVVGASETVEEQKEEVISNPFDKYFLLSAADTDESGHIKQFLIESWLESKKQAIDSLRGKFTANQLWAFVDVMNGSWIQAELSYVLRHNFEDGCVFESMDEKWDIDKEQTLKVMDTLSAEEWNVLVLFCMLFWQKHEEVGNEAFIKTMAKNK